MERASMEQSEIETINIEAATSATDDVRALIEELDRTLSMEYLPEQRHGLALEAIFAPHMRFFIAKLEGAAVGCGGVALCGTFAEVKRMYVCERARGRGIAPALLSRIELVSRENAIDMLRLETGERQVAAIRFYERAGFRRCDAFGEYAAMKPQAIATSIFFEKRLDLGKHTSGERGRLAEYS